jgi:uncharacterized protein (DUF427 family)
MQSNITQERVPIHGDAGHWLHVSQSPRHVRVFFGGELIASSKRAKLVREAEVLPAYYFPKEDVRVDLFTASAQQADCPIKGAASYWSIGVGAKLAENAAWSYVNPLPAASAIKDHFAFDWPKMDSKNLFARGRWQQAAERLDAALQTGLATPLVRAEAIHTRLEVACALGQRQVVSQAGELYAKAPGVSQGRRLSAARLVERCLKYAAANEAPTPNGDTEVPAR